MLTSLLRQVSHSTSDKYSNTKTINEFVTNCSNADAIIDACAKEGILAGLKLSDTEILWCATELNTACEIEKVAAIVKEVC